MRALELKSILRACAINNRQPREEAKMANVANRSGTFTGEMKSYQGPWPLDNEGPVVWESGEEPLGMTLPGATIVPIVTGMRSAPLDRGQVGYSVRMELQPSGETYKVIIIKSYGAIYAIDLFFMVYV